MSIGKKAFVRIHRRQTGNPEFNDFSEVGELQFYVPSLQRIFNYCPMGTAIGVPKARELAIFHVRYISSFARRTALAHHQALTGLAEHIAANADKLGGLRSCASLTTGNGAGLWREAVEGYVQALEAVPRKVTTFAEVYGNLFRTLDELTSCGVSASCHRRPLPKNYHAAGGHRPTLVEQSGQNNVNAELVTGIVERFNEMKLEVEGKDIEHLIRALAAHVPAELLTDEIALADAIFNLNAKALNDIRRLAEDTFIEWRDVWEKGQQLIAQSDPEVYTAVKALTGLSKHEKISEINRLFSLVQEDKARSNFLRLIQEIQGPYAGESVYIKWPARMKRIFGALGGRYYFDACFSLHRRGVVAAILLYLTDSGANVSTALNLSIWSEQETDDPNLVELISHKDRAGPDPIVKHLPIRDPGVRLTAAQALRDVVRMTQSRRELFPDVGDALFIATFFSKPAAANMELVANNLNYMLRDASYSNVRWTPSSIRTSVALDTSGRNSGNLSEVARQLDHAVNSSSTPIYGLRFAARLVLTRRIREFTTLLEVAFATNAPQGTEVLLYPSEIANQLLQKAHRTGLGFLCKDPMIMGGRADALEPSCPQLGHCPQCSAHVYIVTVENLAETIALHDALAEQVELYEEARSNLWKKEWLQIYAHCIALLQTVRRSQFAYMVPKATRLAAKIRAEGFDPMLIKN